MQPEFVEFRSIARYSRPIVITEKIDGMNCQLFITPDGDIHAGVRTGWITPDTDHEGLGMGFLAWATEHKNDLLKLGKGRHFGEWYGHRIGRGYGMADRRFALFNTKRWNADTKPACCDVVPILYSGENKTGIVEDTLAELGRTGSLLVPQYSRPEGVVIYHTAADTFFKKTFYQDEGKTK